MSIMKKEIFLVFYNVVMDENIEMAKILLNNPFTEVKKIKSS